MIIESRYSIAWGMDTVIIQHVIDPSHDCEAGTRIVN